MGVIVENCRANMQLHLLNKTSPLSVIIIREMCQ